MDVAILTATLRLLSEHGYDGLNTDRIAEEAGVSKASIYRRWPSKNDVIVAAAHHLSRSAPVPDTGSLRRDLETIIDGLTGLFGDQATLRLVGSLVARMIEDDDLAAALRDGFLATRRDAARTVLEHARRRGEIRKDVDLDVAVDLLAAPFYYRLLITGAPIERAFGLEVLDALMAWIAPGEARARPRGVRPTGKQRR